MATYSMNSKQPLPILALLSIISIGLSQTAAQAENSISNMVKDVMDGTTNAVRNTAHGAGAVVRSTAHAAGAVVQGTARGAGAVVNAAERAAGLNEDPPYHQPVAGAAANTAVVQAPVKIAAVAPKAAPVSLIGATINIGVDRHGNIIDDSGKLVGRVSVITSDFGAPSDFAGQKLSVTVNGAGEMVDGSGRIIGHILGAEPKIIPVLETPAKEVRTPAPVAPATLAPRQIAPKQIAPMQTVPATSWTEDDILKNTAPLMRGLK